MHVSFTDHPSTIANNYSPTNGGGMWIGQNSFITSNTTVYFINNTAKGVGGAIYDSYSQPNARNNYGTFGYVCNYCTLRQVQFWGFAFTGLLTITLH